eukprot:TRINITY_DN64_c3_g1_i12.p1 TRINITY_DN64_c3_g1~~TRINITY_DN64_c3_g1_i12.p1  ORF type:complete len:962 (+),score=249.62 TRINITY_DN64_c3_g1_i12:366-3251(+)
MSKATLSVGGNPNLTRLVSLETEIQCKGFLSKTSVLMKFLNETNKEQEGELSIPLPDGAIVCGYGLDIDGTIVNSVVVEEQKARVAYEDEDRKIVKEKSDVVKDELDDSKKDSVTYSVTEKVEGNIFKTRIYPLPPNGCRVIKFVYQEQIEQLSSNSSSMVTSYTSTSSSVSTLVTEWNYNFPFSLDGIELEELKIDVTVEVIEDGSMVRMQHTNNASRNVPVLYSPISNTKKEMTLSAMYKIGEESDTENKLTNVKVFKSEEYQRNFKYDIPNNKNNPTHNNTTNNNGVISISVPISNKQIISDIYSLPNKDGLPALYCAIRDTILVKELTFTLTHVHQRRDEVNNNNNQTVAIYWDSSLSRRKSDKTLELVLVQYLIMTKWKNMNVDVVLVRNGVNQTVRFSSPHENIETGISRVVKYLLEVDYDGGTDLSCVFDMEDGDDDDDGVYEYKVLFSDGFHNLSMFSIPELLKLNSSHRSKTCSTPVYCVVQPTNTPCDLSFLETVALHTGGCVVNIQKLNVDNCTKVLDLIDRTIGSSTRLQLISVDTRVNRGDGDGDGSTSMSEWFDVDIVPSHPHDVACSDGQRGITSPSFKLELNKDVSVDKFDQLSSTLSNMDITLNYGLSGRVLHRSKFNLNIRSWIEECRSAIANGTMDKHQHQHQHRHHHHRNHHHDIGIIPTFWSYSKIKELEKTAASSSSTSVSDRDSSEDTQLLCQLGIDYRIVTRNTSMLILESLNQYLEYKITPPPSLPKIREQYLSIIQLKLDFESSSMEDKFHMIKNMWDRRVSLLSQRTSTDVVDRSESSSFNPQILHHLPYGMDEIINQELIMIWGNYDVDVDVVKKAIFKEKMRIFDQNRLIEQKQVEMDKNDKQLIDRMKYTVNDEQQKLKQRILTDLESIISKVKSTMSTSFPNDKTPTHSLLEKKYYYYDPCSMWLVPSCFFFNILTSTTTMTTMMMMIIM